ncbi:very-long-chain 3-oxoacyl-CoA synthase [Malassezia equina]|uniref:Elongation of fatty acids protein n=1 Tax=Malassezia equina TaxID=1381935 RepID=A0AAF0IZR1_9BASI|nr:very-long-chain 3-oxoacyl-CoA synthase [Malassezia equina]
MALAEQIATHLPAWLTQWTAPIHSWKEGVTPMSTLTSVVVASVSYVVVVLGGQALMRPYSPVPAKLVKWPFFFHNLLLSLASLVLLVLYLEIELGFIGKRGLHDALCLRPHFYDVEMYHIINYYFKYWEFIDTFFLVIKKKKLMFLHVYHHMATAALCYSQIVNQTTLSWVIISLNLAVHVIMYGYYAMASVGIRCPWKKWITTGQIVQFVIDVAVCVYGIYKDTYKRAPAAKNKTQ